MNMGSSGLYHSTGITFRHVRVRTSKDGSSVAPAETNLFAECISFSGTPCIAKFPRGNGAIMIESLPVSTDLDRMHSELTKLSRLLRPTVRSDRLCAFTPRPCVTGLGSQMCLLDKGKGLKLRNERVEVGAVNMTC